MQKRSNKGTTTTARETWRARCEDGCAVKTQTLTVDLMTQVLSHTRKFHACGSAECAHVLFSVYTPVVYKGFAIACTRNTLLLGLKNKVRCSSQPNACHHFSDDCHHDEDELDEVEEGYHFHPVFGSTRSAPSLDLENG